MYDASQEHPAVGNSATLTKQAEKGWMGVCSFPCNVHLVRRPPGQHADMVYLLPSARS